MRKFFQMLNIPKQIKIMILKKRIKKHTGIKSNKNILKLIINLLITVTILSGVVYINYKYNNSKVKIGTEAFFGVIVTITILKVILKKVKTRKKGGKISKLILKDEDNKSIKTWDVTDKFSLLIGKKTNVNEVDIDLSDTIYSTLISREHAILNNAGGEWYFEDIGSSNGSGIMLEDTKEKFKVEEGKAYKISCGDVIYIANTKLVLG